jgi:hypothetical protein
MSAADDVLNHPGRFVSLGAVALVFALSLTSCGDYDPEPRATAGGGQTMTAGALATAGQTALGGAGGSAGQAGMGGSSPATGGSTSGMGGGGTVSVTPVEAACTAVAPCGGSVVGTWVAAGSCLPISGNADIAGFGLGCTAAPVTGSLEVAGTWTANADGTFTDQTTTSGDSRLTPPAECLNISGTVTTCDRLGGAFQALGYTEVTCENAASGGGCTCSASTEQTGGIGFQALGAASSGRYTTANNVLTTTSAGSTNAYSYCVSGNTLVMTPQTTGTTGTLTGTIVLVKP